MKHVFHPLAVEELGAIVEFYETRRTGLGLDFAQELYVAIARIAAHPEAGFAISRRTRRGLVNRFPYGLIYQVQSGTLRIIAVADLHRRPGYWRDRL